jgi:multiple sugar transport system ATP-binding protein
MRAEIRELHQRLHTTTIYVTHDQIEAMTMADKIVVMQGGHVEQIGAPLDLYDRPANLFVAGFIGSPAMNMLPGQVEPGGFRAEAGGVWPLPGRMNGAVNGVTGRRAVYGIRPEHFRLAEEGLPAVVHVVEPTGSETQVIAHAGEAKMVCAFRDRIRAQPGETIRIMPDPASVHLFDEETGHRIEAG